MRSLPIKKKAVTILAAGLLIATAGGAYAYWTTTGSGTGSATTGTSTLFTVTTGAASGGALTPGGPTDTVAFHVANPSTGVQHLSAVAVTVANADGSAWTAVSGCSAADYTVGLPSFAAGDISPSGTVSGSVTITMNNLGSSQDGCKLAVVPLHVAAS